MVINLQLRSSKKIDYKYFIIIAIPLILSAFVHTWNAGGFPAVHPDEGTYMRRAMHVLEGLGPQDPSSRFDHSPETSSSYDHPYFGQIFLATIFSIVGFPDSMNFDPTTESSIAMLYAIPRILMGILAMVDTFLVYKIAERRYSRNVAFLAAVLFAVMPITWILRRIVLDSILMPFLLSSILLAFYARDTNHMVNDFRSNNNHSVTSIITFMLSGIFLGIAIFCKAPAFTFIPLVGYIVFIKSNKNVKTLFVWIIPVVLIPLIWPIYAISNGQFDEWLEGVLWQGSQRQGEGRTLLDTMGMFFRIDPALFFLGISGLIYAGIKKDFFLLGLAIPYLVFLYAVGWVTHFHWILILPALCIGSALIISDLSKWIIRKSIRRFAKVLICILIPTTISIFGLASTLLLIETNVSAAQYRALALGSYDIQNNEDSRDEITIVSGPIYSWIFKYILDKDQVFSHLRDSSQSMPINKVLLIADSTFYHILTKDGEEKKQIDLLEKLYNGTNIIATFRKGFVYDSKIYPYTSMREANIGGGEIAVQANY